MADFKILYTGSSKVIRRICEKLNLVPTLGTGHSDAYYGDWGDAAWQHAQQIGGNPHQVTAEDLGLGDLQDQIQMIMDAMGSSNYLVTHESAFVEYIVDHDGSEIILTTAANVLSWH